MFTKLPTFTLEQHLDAAMAIPHPCLGNLAHPPADLITWVFDALVKPQTAVCWINRQAQRIGTP
jgi:hypothetical protein